MLFLPNIGEALPDAVPGLMGQGSHGYALPQSERLIDLLPKHHYHPKHTRARAIGKAGRLAGLSAQRACMCGWGGSGAGNGNGSRNAFTPVLATHNEDGHRLRKDRMIRRRGNNKLILAILGSKRRPNPRVEEIPFRTRWRRSASACAN